MKKKLKKTFIILGSTIFSLLLILVIASMLFLHQKPWVKRILEKQLFKKTGIQIKIGTLDYEIFPLKIAAGKITLTTKLEDTEIDVFVQKLNLVGDIHKIRKKKKPYFDIVEAEGFRINTLVNKASKKMAVEDILNGLSSLMDHVRQINMKNSYLAFTFSKQRIILQGVDFSLSPSECSDSSAYAYILFCRKAEGRSEPIKSSFQNVIHGSGTLNLQKKATIDGHFHLRENLFTVRERSVEFEEVNLRLNGTLDADKNIFSFPDFELNIPFLMSLSCPLTFHHHDDLALLFRPHICFVDLNNLYSTAQDFMPFQLDGFEIDGSMSFEGQAEFSPSQTPHKIQVTGKIIMEPIRVTYRTSLFNIDGKLSGDITIDDFPDNQDFSGRLEISETSYSSKFTDASGIDAGFNILFDGEKSKLDLSDVKANIRDLSFDTLNRKFEFHDTGFQGKARVDPKKGIFHLFPSTVRLSPFPPIHIEARGGLGQQVSQSLHLQSSAIGMQSLLEYFSALIPRNIKDWEPEGNWDLQFEARKIFQEQDNAWEVSAQLGGSSVRFHDPSFSLAGESLEPRLVFKGTFRRSFDDFPFSIDFNLAHGESLWKDFYIDWNKMPIKGKIQGLIRASQKKFTDLSVEAAVPVFGKISSQGFIDMQEPLFIDLSVSATELDLSAIYSFITQKGSVGQIPVDLQGKAESRFAAKGNLDVFSITGHVEIKNASMATRDKTFSIKEMSGHLPFCLEKNDAFKESEAVANEAGHMTFRDMHVSSADIPFLELGLSSRRNGLTIDPFELEIFTAEVSIGKTVLEFGLDMGSFKGQSSLVWNDVDLSHLPYQTKQFNLQGKLGIEVPLLEIFPDRIRAEGIGKMEAYGGNIIITDIQMEHPFSKNRTISCNVNFGGLDLEKITDAIPFGRVTGIVSGEIQNLAFSYGQPERFVFHLESEKRKGIPQRFSLKATNDLAILGTGEKTPFSPQSGWTRIIKDFRYNKIGISCSLKNDIFSLQGTIHKKGIEYLVKGSGLFAINVVNKQARNQIQFKDMLSRLKRIGQAKQSP